LISAVIVASSALMMAWNLLGHRLFSRPDVTGDADEAASQNGPYAGGRTDRIDFPGAERVGRPLADGPPPGYR
jgi:hypothetical protein